IWSVALGTNGVPIPASTQRELQMPPFTVRWSNPVSDINFNASGEMFLSERSMQTYGNETGDRGLLHQGNAIGNTARLMKFTQIVPQVWGTNNEFRVGSFGTGENSAGGATLDCAGNP